MLVCCTPAVNAAGALALRCLVAVRIAGESGKMQHLIHSAYKSVAERVIPVRSSPGFREKGVITPEEFVAAGDFLVTTCPTWSWESGDRSKRKAYLPAEKQFLITRNVPCFRRAAAVEEVDGEELLEGGGAGDDSDWVAPARSGGAAGGASAMEEDIPSVDDVGKQAAGAADDDDDDVPDMDDFAGQGAADDADAAALPTGYLVAREPVDNFVKTRTYDVSITYDKYYQTPRIWLVGYDEARMPLTPEKALEDVSHEHARKTVTVDGHPHTGVNAASIHPCRHGAVMKKIVDMMADGGGEPQVEHYLFVFLKFMASIIPTVEYDHTLGIKT